MTALELQPTRKVDETFWLGDQELSETREAVVRALGKSAAEGHPPDVGGALMHCVLVALDELVEQRARAMGRTIPLQPWPAKPEPPPPPPPPQTVVPAAMGEAPPLTGRVTHATLPVLGSLGLAGGPSPSEIEVQLDGAADGTKIVGQEIAIFPKGAGYNTVKVLSVSVDQDRYQGSLSFRVAVSMPLPPGMTQGQALTLSRSISGHTAALILHNHHP